MTVERIIRPFAAGDVFTAKALPAVESDYSPKDLIVATFGNPITLQMAAVGGLQYEQGVNLTEVSRKTKTVRITNPNDPTQFVDVEKITGLIMQDENTQQRFFKFE